MRVVTAIPKKKGGPDRFRGYQYFHHMSSIMWAWRVPMVGFQQYM